MVHESIVLESPSFGPGGVIPRRHTCQGEGVSPEIRWHAFPESTQSFVLLLEDLDVPAPGLRLSTWVHWAVYDIPASVTRLAEGVPNAPRLQDGARQAVTSFRRPGYGGPCPVWGTHRYRFQLFALDRRLDLEPERTRKRDLVRAMQGHVLAAGELLGTCRRRR